MRNVLLSFFSALLLFQAGGASAQILTQSGSRDSVGGNNASGEVEFPVYNRIKSGSSTPVKLEWKVISHNLGNNPGWPMYDANLPGGAAGAGFCDNVLCYSYNPAVPASNLFNDSMITHRSDDYTSTTFEGTKNDFHMLFICNNPAIGSSAYVRVRANDLNGGGSRVLTFIGYRAATGVTNTVSNEDIVLYPNPAREAVNVIYDPNAGVKTIAVYNLIGKLMGPVYRPSASGSAKIALEDMPNGVYFLRLMDGRGNVIATRRFNRQ